MRAGRIAAGFVLCLLAGCGGKADAPPMPAASTLQATLVDPDGDGALRRGPGEPLRDRNDLGGKGRPGAVLATVAQLTDTHVRDEESPAACRSSRGWAACSARRSGRRRRRARRCSRRPCGR